MSFNQIHLAGQPSGLVQKCRRCGVVLVDYRNAASVGDWRPHWFRGAVEQVPSGMVSVRFPPNCGATP